MISRIKNAYFLSCPDKSEEKRGVKSDIRKNSQYQIKI
ncbi:Uncharacterized protein dnm_006370 [Desulfonema magnum]|uniref:Uncharacterized protein n=1 Tax=Desulfonema magnum TaxID=45655 RepID=A0A975BG27_9BACT|nr:Uncharacterized protein dnm_006370 [Desulfonema magnum]